MTGAGANDPRLELARGFYDAVERHDGAGILEHLDPGFVGEVTAGLPKDWGGRYEGPEEMLARCWGCVFAELDTRPVARELIPTEDGRLLVRGFYRGTARASGRVHEAEFAHLLSFRDGRISGLWQLTDSHRWHEALER